MAAKKKAAPVVVTPPRPMERPRVEVRITWPKAGSHSAAMQRIGRGMLLLIEQSTETKQKEGNGLGYSYDRYDTTVNHFDITSKHEVECE